MKTRWRFQSILIVMLLLTGSLVMTAQDSPSEPATAYPPSATGPANGATGPTNTDPPGRVARVQYMSGEVSIQPGGVNDWIAASLNRPLTTSDRVWTDKNSKAELNVGGGFLRMNSESSLTLTNVSDNTLQVELDQGTLEMTVGYLAPGQIYEVDTPNLAFTVMKPGVYRFNVFPSEDQTWVTVRKGYGQATGSGAAVKVKAGQQARFSSGTSLQHVAEAAPDPDGFDDWAKVRDQRLDSSVSAQYVSPGVIGYQDLDTYGSWRVVAPYGPIWTPYSVPVGWAPYRFGSWVWIAPWGWTWVDSAPWGFAPFHYGRWVSYGGYWGWAPGPYRSWSTCYAPALVGWLGGPGFGVGFGFGGPGWGVGINVGWFPLGWGEPYYPWYHGWYGRGLSAGYIRNVNVTNTYIRNVNYVTNNYYSRSFGNTHYVNRTVNGAVTAAPQSAIAHGQPINRFGHAVPESGLQHASMVRNISTTPTRSAMLGGEQPREHGVPASSAFNRSVVTHATPPGYARPMQARLNTPSALSAGNESTHSAARAPNSASGATGYSSGHYVPRPPSAGGETNAMRSAGPVFNSSHNVSRQPSVSAENNGYSAHGRSPAMSGAYGESRAMGPSVQSRAVPHPPSSYTYHAAQPYTAESRNATGLSNYGGGSRGSYPSSRSYSAGQAYNPRGTYSGATPYVHENRGSASVQSRASYGGASAVPHYSAPAGGSPHYSAPSGGGSHYSAPSGGGGHYSAPSGGGGHGGGGASHAGHSGGGGGHSR